ncbi:hypothetical protein [Nocardia gipuzkoensis]|uniref:hypothetical protein n=1 Tax=Nocardia gipuzkoensis TaxID=2749991 RepID=UPI00237D4CF4|nr:hypothetical protein [Nocardia gipuzkoensis]MDE1674758.1 hypothetical protein [Nocardia gipuzkoensis]
MTTPRQKALIYINGTASPDPALDLRHALALADAYRLDVLHHYVTGPMRPPAFRDLMRDVRALRVATVIVPRVEDNRLKIIRGGCAVLDVETRNVYPPRDLSLDFEVAADGREVCRV